MSLWDNFFDALTAGRRRISLSISHRIRWTGWTNKEAKMPPQFKWFKSEEIVGLDTELVARLDMARGWSGVPFVITSGLRTQQENDALPESVKDSTHVTGHAVDLVCNDSVTRFKMMKALLDVGFNRIGIYANHLHCDNATDPDHPQGVLWYVEGS